MVTGLFRSDARELLPCDGSAVLHDWVLGDSSWEPLIKGITEETRWEQRSIVVFGREHPQPRLTAWHGDPGCAYTYSSVRMEPHPWTDRLAGLRDLCEEVAGAGFNSVLLNLYRDGNDAMGWHRDNEPELGHEPVIASLSLGEPRKFRFRHRTTRETVDTVLGPGSLVVMSGACQTHWEHSVPRQTRVSAPRINLTFRRIEQVQKRG